MSGFRNRSGAHEQLDLDFPGLWKWNRRTHRVYPEEENDDHVETGWEEREDVSWNEITLESSVIVTAGPEDMAF